MDLAFGSVHINIFVQVHKLAKKERDQFTPNTERVSQFKQFFVLLLWLFYYNASFSGIPGRTNVEDFKPRKKSHWFPGKEPTKILLFIMDQFAGVLRRYIIRESTKRKQLIMKFDQLFGGSVPKNVHLLNIFKQLSIAICSRYLIFIIYMAQINM